MNTETEMTDEELDHERACCERFVQAQSNYIKVCTEDRDAWLEANEALEELWAAYQASPCACSEKPPTSAATKYPSEYERAMDKLCDAQLAVRKSGTAGRASPETIKRDDALDDAWEEWNRIPAR